MIIEADIDGDGQVDPEMVLISIIILSGQFYWILQHDDDRLKFLHLATNFFIIPALAFNK